MTYTLPTRLWSQVPESSELCAGHVCVIIGLIIKWSDYSKPTGPVYNNLL